MPKTPDDPKDSDLPERFEAIVEVPEIQEPKRNELKGLKQCGPFTISGTWVTHEFTCGACQQGFDLSAEGGIGYATLEHTGENIPLCPACFVALSSVEGQE